MTHLKVAVRVRPMSQREKDLKAAPIVKLENNKTISITNLKVREQHAGDSRDRVRRFTFDRCFAENATQQDLFETVSLEVHAAIQNRFNSCVLAYGQSASGKTHTMIGLDEDSGIIPRLCQSIFHYLEKQGLTADECIEDEQIRTKQVGYEEECALATVSYLEIYNEKVRDLLCLSNDSESKISLRVREHPRKGPYVQGLSEKPASTASTLLHWLRVGNASRQIAATGSNPHSSRSHSVFTISCYQGQSKVHLVDLAGSERPGKKCCTTTIFREGANINRSLVALGNVISTLAEHSTKYSRHLRKRFVPFRDSILTWLLKDTLGGNSKTIMIATVSPASTCYNETVNTLRFGQRAKQIAVQPVRNEDPKERIIRNLRLEIEALKSLLLQANKINADCGLRLPILNQFISCSSPSILSDISSISINSASPTFTNSTDSLYSSVTLEAPVVLSDSVKSELSEEDSNNNVKNLVLDNRFIVTSEKLIPVMNITTSVNKPDKSKLRRTFSVVEHKEKAPKEQFTSQEVLDNSATSSRKHSLEKLKKPIVAKSPQSQKSVEKGVGTEIRSPPKVEIKSRVDSIRRASVPKQRSQIIASVTQRLYNKVKKKEIGTGTEDLIPEPTKPAEELNICSNARLKLRELTQKALRAHKWKTVDTQTDLFPVLRVKEISTDVDDLQIALLEVKHAEISTDFVATSDTGVDCCILQQFSEGDRNINSFLVTRTCGTQSIQEELSQPVQAKIPPPTAISFRKYLQAYHDPQMQVINPSSPSLIYTNSVNLNVSQHFPVRQYSDASSQSSSTARKTSETHSQDSLDEDYQCLNPTPDLISNHNSLEQQSQVAKIETYDPVKFASTTLLQQELYMNQDNDFTLDNDICTANCSIAPICQERLESATLQSCFSTESCIHHEEERCHSFSEYYCKHHPVYVEESRRKFDECVRLSEPLVLKSIMKNYDSDSSSSCLENDKFRDLPDSLDYHQVNMKRVRFESETPNSCGNVKMVEAMAGFLKEATTLMSTLSLVATKADQGERETSPKVVLAETKTQQRTKKRRSRSHIERHHCCKRIYNETIATQTSPKHHHVNDDENSYSVPQNQYDLLVKDSCDRLERCIDRLETKTTSEPSQEELLHRFPQPFSAMPAPFNVQPFHGSPISLQTEDTSLESSHTFSDYGSLPRRRSRRVLRVSCSPSGYLKQLTSMRRKIVDGSREQLEKAGCSSGSINI